MAQLCRCCQVVRQHKPISMASNSNNCQVWCAKRSIHYLSVSAGAAVRAEPGGRCMPGAHFSHGIPALFDHAKFDAFYFMYAQGVRRMTTAAAAHATPQPVHASVRKAVRRVSTSATLMHLQAAHPGIPSTQRCHVSKQIPALSTFQSLISRTQSVRRMTTVAPTQHAT